MPRKMEHDLDTVLHAIRGTGPWAGTPNKVTSSAGVVVTVAQRLGVSRTTVYKYLKHWASAQHALDEERESVLDLAENKLYAQVSQGNMTAIIFLLKTRGRHRGYIERQEIEQQGDINIKVIEVDGSDS